MLTLSCYIEITTAKGIIQLNQVHNVNIQTSVTEATDTASISIAKKILIKQKDEWATKPIGEVIKAADKVKIQLGYDGKLTTEFIGYVKSVSPKVPLEIECEDSMYLLKRSPVNPKHFKNGKLSDVIKYIAPGYKYDILDTELGKDFIITDQENTATKVLAMIEEVFGLKSFFKLDIDTPILIVGKPYLSELSSTPVKYELNRNVISNDLELQRAEDVELKVEVKSRQANGKYLTAKFKGDTEGDTKSLSIPGLSQNELENIAKRLYSGSKQDRFDGSITTFGIPAVKKGYAVEISTKDYEITKTVNFVDEVAIDFGINGFRRTIKIGQKAA